MTLLDVKNLSVGSGKGTQGPLIENVSFSVASGEILGVVGESGAGKSLTGLSVLGLLQPPLGITSGSVTFKGNRIDALDDAALTRLRGRHIAAVFQDSLTSLNPLMTVGRQLTETMLAHLPITRKEAKARALQLLTDLGIPSPKDRLSAYPHQLSGGMRQRVVIALALCCDPELIIADEPTTALDVSVQAQIIDLLVDLRDRRGVAVMLITHDMGVIARAANRVAVMYAGRVVEMSPVRDLLQAPQHPYTQSLIATIPRMKAKADRLTQIAGAMPPAGNRPQGCAFHPRCPKAFQPCREEAPPFVSNGNGEAACWLLTQRAAVAQMESADAR